MGSYAPVPGFDDDAVERLVDLTCRPVVAELAARGHPFVGTLFAGLMLTADGPQVLEYNCRFGDPETQSLLPLLGGDLLAALAAAAAGDLERVELEPAAGAAVTVVLAGGDYPAPATSALRSRGSRRPRQRARSSSTPARRCTTAPRDERRPDPQRHGGRRRHRVRPGRPPTPPPI